MGSAAAAALGHPGHIGVDRDLRPLQHRCRIGADRAGVVQGGLLGVEHDAIERGALGDLARRISFGGLSVSIAICAHSSTDAG